MLYYMFLFLSHHEKYPCLPSACAGPFLVSNITDITLSMQKIDSKIELQINPVSAAKHMLFETFHRYPLHLETIFVSEQRYTLTWGNVITYETNR